jgi:hypothetical protein
MFLLGSYQSCDYSVGWRGDKETRVDRRPPHHGQRTVRHSSWLGCQTGLQKEAKEHRYVDIRHIPTKSFQLRIHLLLSIKIDSTSKPFEAIGKSVEAAPQRFEQPQTGRSWSNRLKLDREASRNDWR